MKYLRIIAALVLICGLASCGSGEKASSTTPNDKGAKVSADGLTHYDMSKWRLPTDPYREADTILISRARTAYFRYCMKSKGYTYQGRPEPPEGQAERYVNSAGRRLFDEKIASEVGYHVGIVPGWNVYQYSHDTIEKYKTDPGYRDAKNSCFNKLMDQYPVLKTYEEKSETGNALLASIGGAEQGLEDPKVKKLVSTWKQCMKPLGLSDLPDNPVLMPGPQLSQKIGLNPGADAPQSAIAASPGTVSEYERKIAVADAKCRISSGWQQAYYDADWNSADAYVKKNQKELSARLGQIKQVEATCREIVKKYS